MSKYRDANMIYIFNSNSSPRWAERTPKVRAIITNHSITVMPHHSQRNPAKHSAVKQLFLHTAHFELVGRLPSRQWWVCFTADKSFAGRYVAFSLQSATAKSWHSTCTKYSHTTGEKHRARLTSRRETHPNLLTPRISYLDGKLTFTVYGWIIIESLPTDVAEFPFAMYLFGPTVCNRVLQQRQQWRNAVNLVH